MEFGTVSGRKRSGDVVVAAEMKCEALPSVIAAGDSDGTIIDRGADRADNVARAGLDLPRGVLVSPRSKGGDCQRFVVSFPADVLLKGLVVRSRHATAAAMPRTTTIAHADFHLRERKGSEGSEAGG